jgi:hypothetical protein
MTPQDITRAGSGHVRSDFLQRDSAHSFRPADSKSCAVPA